MTYLCEKNHFLTQNVGENMFMCVLKNKKNDNAANCCLILKGLG